MHFQSYHLSNDPMLHNSITTNAAQIPLAFVVTLLVAIVFMLFIECSCRYCADEQFVNEIAVCLECSYTNTGCFQFFANCSPRHPVVS